MIEYEYGKLRGRIRECFIQQSEFAQKLGISETSLSNKLNNKTAFDQDEIYRVIEMFDLSAEETLAYFFTTKVDKKSTK